MLLIVLAGDGGVGGGGAGLFFLELVETAESIERRLALSALRGNGIGSG